LLEQYSEDIIFKCHNPFLEMMNRMRDRRTNLTMKTQIVNIKVQPRTGFDFHSRSA
jgi:hypothetical protein